jgi:hypothetical protein
MRLVVGLIFTVALIWAGWVLGAEIGGPQYAKLFGLAGGMFALLVLVATRTRAL